MEAITAFLALLGVALGAALGAFLTHSYNRKRDHLELKRDVLRRVMGCRWQLTGRGTYDNAIFTALNEIPVIFAGDKEVENAFHELSCKHPEDRFPPGGFAPPLGSHG